jgi:transcriptional regulator with XRE-family HTH domain
MPASGHLEAAFGPVLRQYRLAAGLSQEALAHAANLHPTYISLLERNVHQPTLAVVEALAGALGCRPYELVKAAEDAPGGSNDVAAASLSD